MAPSLTVDLLLIRTAKDKETAAYILQLLQQHSPTDICNTLLGAVEAETISPLIFSIFLSATKSCECIVLCLRQPISIFVRRQAIKHYGKAFQDPARWQIAWKAMGSTEGILRYLSSISVDEVKRFLTSIGGCNRGDVRPPQREQAIEQLLKAMSPALYPDALYKTTDKRPLDKYAIQLVPACSDDFISDLMAQGAKNHLYSGCSKTRLTKTHGTLLRDYAVRTTFNSVSKELPSDVYVYLLEFTSREPGVTADEHKFSASMAFSEQLLEKRLEHPDLPWPSYLSESQIYISLLHRCFRRKVTKQRLHQILDLGLRLLNTKAHLKNDFIVQDHFFWAQITVYWGKDPERWEDLVVKGLRLGLGSNSKRNISVGFTIFASKSGIKDDRTWPLLRLFCLHVPKNGVDIEVTTELKALARQKWDTQVFNRLSNDKAIRLLKGLLRANPNFDFLDASSGDSILSMQTLYDQHNFNALLYLTQLQTRSVDTNQQAEAAKRAEDAVADLKRKSASSREQPDRAQYAKAAGLFAIASGSLDIYGELVEWLQRFIRDPLTVKVIFHRDSIATIDASNLLSGIPKQLGKGASLSKISASVAKANEILLKFHAHKQLAKREPSFQAYDWKAVSALLRAAIKTRIYQAKQLQKMLNAADGELYGAIWSQTFAMFSQVGVESMHEISDDLSKLMVELPPKTLATTTKSMLETDDKYRKTKSTGKEAEAESRIVEGLSYTCLLALAKGDKPALAEELIVRTIIDRPDASSWHRQMLSITFFKRLPAKNAEQLLLGFAKAIGEKLEEQSYIRIGEAAGTPSFVKVTTVKYLAQLLQDAQFLSAEASIDVLLELFKVATHPDIRLATLESMLSTLNTLCNAELHSPVTNISDIRNPLIHKILAALDAVAPVVGSINERRPPREQDWAEARADLSKLPEPASSRPLWTALFSAANSSTALKTYFVDHLLLPALHHSMAEHQKWLTLFLAKHSANFGAEELPQLPVDPGMMHGVLYNFTALVPAQLLASVGGYTRFSLDTPAAITSFNIALKADEEKCNKPDVKHWFSLFDRSADQAFKDGTMQLIGLLLRDWKPAVAKKTANEHITVQQVQIIVTSHLGIVLDAYDANIKSWDMLMEKLRHPTNSAEDFTRWERDCRPVLEKVVRMIDAKRTPEWSRDPNRKPSILASTSRLILWLLRHPIPGTVQPMIVAQQTGIFASQLLKFIRDQLTPSNGRLNVAKLVEDIMTVSEKLDNNQRLRVATIIGVIPEDDVTPVVEVVQVDAAMRFIEQGREALKTEKELKEEVQEMVTRWQKSLVEEVRERILDWKMNDRGLWNDVLAGTFRRRSVVAT